VWITGINIEPMPVPMRWFIAICGTLAMLVSYFVIWREERKARISMEIREILGRLLIEGTHILIKFRTVRSTVFTMQDDYPYNDFQEWDTRIEAALTKFLDISYVSRLRNSSGLCLPNVDKGSKRDQLLADIHVRLIKLDEFIRELANHSR
jgi:hypothetical protein